MSFKTTPDLVTELSKCEIFVFGSNLQGHHNGGSARIANQIFGAEWGIGVGPTGQCYAIPTMFDDVESIKPYVDDFIDYAKSHPNNRFLVTRLGCGIAGFTDEQIAPLFENAFELPNVHLPEKWREIIFLPRFIDAYCGCPPSSKKSVAIPTAINEHDLYHLCEKYKYLIGTGIKNFPMPEITIRYVIDTNRFGYARFGDFFFWSPEDLYVWTRNKEFENDHNQDIVEDYFNDECKNRGFCHRVIFAGIRTPYNDSTGSPIYTGDVLRVATKGYDNSSTITDDNFHNYSDILAFGTLGENDNDSLAKYCFPLDNHCILPDMVARWERIGTIFYQLNWNRSNILITDRCFEFQNIYGQGPSKEHRLIMARYTPNFDQEEWKYMALDTLGCEDFNWR